MTLNEALKKAQDIIKNICDNPARVAKILLMHHLNASIEHIFLNLDKNLKNKDEYFALIYRFANFEPLEYITGKVGFYSLVFNIKKGVLIPRAETEILVEKALKILKNLNAPRVCEIGTGSGVISICLALNSNAVIAATDINESALNLAKQNAAKFEVNRRINFIKCAYMNAVKGEFDLIISNPPYIANSYKLDNFVKNEPENALFGGEAGDEILKDIILLAKERKVKFLACEMGYNQRQSLENVLKENNFKAEFYRDLAGFDRGFVAKFLG